MFLLFTVLHHSLKFSCSHVLSKSLHPSTLLTVYIPSVVAPSRHSPPIYNIEYQEKEWKDAEECHICLGVALSSTSNAWGSVRLVIPHIHFLQLEQEQYDRILKHGSKHKGYAPDHPTFYSGKTFSLNKLKLQ